MAENINQVFKNGDYWMSSQTAKEMNRVWQERLGKSIKTELERLASTENMTKLFSGSRKN